METQASDSSQEVVVNSNVAAADHNHDNSLPDNPRSLGFIDKIKFGDKKNHRNKGNLEQEMGMSVRNPELGMTENRGGEDKDGGESSLKKGALILTDLGEGSQVYYAARFFSSTESWNYFDYLNINIPWTRPTIHVFGRACIQPRDTCYIASQGLPELRYSGYKPHAYSWDEFPPLKDILDAVHSALPGSNFNSLLLNRYNGGSDSAGWHADDEKLYGPTPEIASVSFGCERDFLLKKKKTSKTCQGGECEGEPPKKRSKVSKDSGLHTFMLKHGSLLVMKGYTQRDWVHSVPKRVKAESTMAVEEKLLQRLVEKCQARNLLVRGNYRGGN